MQIDIAAQLDAICEQSSISPIPADPVVILESLIDLELNLISREPQNRSIYADPSASATNFPQRSPGQEVLLKPSTIRTVNNVESADEEFLRLHTIEMTTSAEVQATIL
jgi:hypothetical protein